MAIQSNVFYFLSLGFNYIWDASKFVNRMGTGKLNFRRRRKCLSKKDCSLYILNVEFKCQYLMKHCYLLWKSTIILGGPFGHLIMKVLGWPRGFIIFLPKRYFFTLLVWTRTSDARFIYFRRSSKRKLNFHPCVQATW